MEETQCDMGAINLAAKTYADSYANTLGGGLAGSCVPPVWAPEEQAKYKAENEAREIRYQKESILREETTLVLEMLKLGKTFENASSTALQFRNWYDARKTDLGL